MKKYFICFFFSLISTSVAVSKSNTHYVKQNFCDTIKITYENGIIYVPVKTKDKEYKFIFDTGAKMFLLNDTLKSFFKDVKDSIVFADFYRKERNTKHGFVQDFNLGKNIYSNYEYVITNLGLPVNCDGIMGSGCLIENGISVKIDIKDSILILTDRKGMFDNEQGIDIPYKSNLKIKFTMSYGCSGWATFDTGANSFMVIGKKEYYDKPMNGKDKEMFRRQIDWSDVGNASHGAHGLEEYSEHIYMNINEVKFGKIIFHNIPIEVSPGSTVVGCRILEYGSMIINTDQKKMKYQPYDYRNGAHINEKNEDVIYKCENNNILVAMINPDSDIYKQGLRKKFRMIEYNKFPVNSLNDYFEAKKATKIISYSAKFMNELGNIIEIVFNR